MEILTLMMIQNIYYANNNMICLYSSTHIKIYIQTHMYSFTYILHVRIYYIYIYAPFCYRGRERQSRKIGKQLQSVATDFCTKGGTLQIWRLKAWCHFCRMGLVINHSSEIWWINPFFASIRVCVFQTSTCSFFEKMMVNPTVFQ